jgi:hypothetical protein
VVHNLRCVFIILKFHFGYKLTHLFCNCLQIVKFLEQKSQKEFRLEHVSFIKIITEAYCKLLFVCKEQM